VGWWVLLGDEEDDGEGEGDRQDPRDDRPSTAAALLEHGNCSLCIGLFVHDEARWLTPSVAMMAWPRSRLYCLHQTETQATSAADTPAGSGSSTVCPVYGPGVHCTALNCTVLYWTQCLIFVLSKSTTSLKAVKSCASSKNPIRLYGPKY